MVKISLTSYLMVYLFDHQRTNKAPFLDFIKIMTHFCAHRYSKDKLSMTKSMIIKHCTWPSETASAK